MKNKEEFQGEYHVPEAKRYIILTRREVLEDLAEKLSVEWVRSSLKQLESIGGREITIETYREEADHLARILRSMKGGMAILTRPEWFQKYIFRIDPDLDGRAFSFREVTVSLQADLMEIEKIKIKEGE